MLILVFSYSSIAGTLIYQYDELNRLIQAQYPDGTVIDYSYDVVGNRSKKEVKLENLCEGDFDGDGDVDGSDQAVFAADFGRTDCTGSQDPCEGDFDNDGDVDGSDLAVFAADFGRTDCPH